MGLQRTCASVTFRCGTVLPYLIHKEDLRHIVYYQDFGQWGTGLASAPQKCIFMIKIVKDVEAVIMVIVAM